MRPHRCTTGRRLLLPRDWHWFRNPRCRLDLSQHVAWHQRGIHRCHHVVVGAVTDGTIISIRAGVSHRRRRFKRSVCIFHLPDHQRRCCRGEGAAHHLHGRVGLGAPCPSRPSTRRVSGPDVSRRAGRSSQRGISIDRELSAGEGLPGMGQRHRARHHADRSGSGLGSQDSRGTLVHRPRCNRAPARRGRLEVARHILLRPQCCPARP